MRFADLKINISSWEALAQLCRPGNITIQSGSDNTGAEANINHGFSNTEVLSDVIKLVSLQQVRCNIFLNIHHIPGEKNSDADDLSRGRTSNFCSDSQVLIHLVDIFNPSPFPRYINTSVQRDPDIHANAKTLTCSLLHVDALFFFVSCFSFHLIFTFHLQPFQVLISNYVPSHCGQTFPQ